MTLPIMSLRGTPRFVIARSGIPRFTRNKLRNPQVKNVVAQFIGQLCLMNQATTKCGGQATWTDTLQGKS